MIEFLTKVAGSTEFWSGLGGAVVGGLFTLWGTVIEGKRERDNREQDNLSKKLNILKGIRTEIELITSLYNERMGAHISNYKPGQLLDVYFLITQNNFVFYENNAEFISELGEDVLKEIVRFYITAKSLIDTYNTNNTNLNEVKTLSLKVADNPHNHTHVNLLNAYMGIASQYAPMIVEIHNQTVESQRKAISAINGEINRLETK
ncbi:hypothetical protein [Enterobacter roggenkampii]|uniref:hypothetical protein n=1 Tax=Enterobacter roggenkampii TaxID=1812935 RepID=UPI001C6FFC6E|nr:hypothetical protein [Enterobacter roggenkampii]MBW9466549.1 hypothetical protein [Enterobacter roggenkampii]